MKIIEQTHTRLTLKHRPIAIWLSGALTIILGLVFLIYSTVFASVSASLKCDRPTAEQVNCELRRFHLLASTEKVKIFDPDAAEVIITHGSRGSRSYRVMISTPFGEVPLLSQSDGSYETNQRAATQINHFISTQESSLYVQEEVRSTLLLSCLFGLAMAAVGVFLVTTPIATCTFYRSLRKVVLERQGWRSGQTIEHSIDQILLVDVENKRAKYGKVYRAVLVLVNQERIPLHQDYTDEKSVHNAAYAINRFLESK